MCVCVCVVCGVSSGSFPVGIIVLSGAGSTLPLSMTENPQRLESGGIGYDSDWFEQRSSAVHERKCQRAQKLFLVSDGGIIVLADSVVQEATLPFPQEGGRGREG